MHISLVTLGSRGDVQPFIALGCGLQQAGHHVRLVTNETYRDSVMSNGLDFAQIAGDIRALMLTPDGRTLVDAGHDMLRFTWNAIQMAKEMVAQSYTDALAACQGSDAILFTPTGFVGGDVAEKLRVASAVACLQPFSRTRAFPNMLLPNPLPLGGAYNWTTHLLAEQLAWQPFQQIINQSRRTLLALPPHPVQGPYHGFHQRKTMFLYGYSRHVLPKPDDWGDWLHITGYWFLDQASTWEPPPALAAFLADGPAPIAVGFGSMTTSEPTRLAALLIDAIARSGQRAILLRGWGGIDVVDHPAPTILALDEAPHDWLFPRMAAVVHHGGVGTTAAAFRAGVPQLVVPFLADQPFWGQRVAALGAGPAPIPRKHLTAARLAESLERVAHQQYHTRAAALGAAIRAENGITQAVTLIEQHLIPHQPQVVYG